MTFEERIEFLFQSIESHDRQIGENAEAIAKNADAIERLQDAVGKLVTVSNQDAASIQALARIAEAHERPITDIEDRPH